MFYQVEGLVVDEGITFAHLKGTFEFFLKTLFTEKTKVEISSEFFRSQNLRLRWISVVVL